MFAGIGFSLGSFLSLCVCVRGRAHKRQRQEQVIPPPPPPMGSMCASLDVVGRAHLTVGTRDLHWVLQQKWLRSKTRHQEFHRCRGLGPMSHSLPQPVHLQSMCLSMWSIQEACLRHATWKILWGKFTPGFAYWQILMVGLRVTHAFGPGCLCTVSTLPVTVWMTSWGIRCKASSGCVDWTCQLKMQLNCPQYLGTQLCFL